MSQRVMNYGKHINERRGHGRMHDYKPWLKIRDTSLLSRVEERYLCLLDWYPLTIDIREQFPLLPLDDNSTEHQDAEKQN